MDLTIDRSLRERATLPSWRRAEEVAGLLLAETGHENAEVSVVLTDDPGIHALNKQWRGYDKPTDVLSWPQEDDEILGDVVISLDTAERQAIARGWPVEEEIALLLVHGILHLLGHEDDTEEGSNGMRAIEAGLLGKPLDPL